MLRIFGQSPPILSSSMGQLERLKHIPRPAIARDLRSPLASSLSEARGLLDWLEEAPCKRFHLPPPPQPRCQEWHCYMQQKNKKLHMFFRRWKKDTNRKLSSQVVTDKMTYRTGRHDDNGTGVTTWEVTIYVWFFWKKNAPAVQLSLHVFATHASSLSWISGLLPAC